MFESENSNPDAGRSSKIRAHRASSLVGHMLVALPGMPDQRFARAVIYIVSHGIEGARGIVINRPLGTMGFAELLLQLEIPVSESCPAIEVMQGGPVEAGRGFVLHSSEFTRDGTAPISAHISMTSTIDILRAIASGKGPARQLVALGYAGWLPGQIEEELQGNNWLTVPGDAGLVFSADADAKWEQALAKLGATPALLSAHAGRA